MSYDLPKPRRALSLKKALDLLHRHGTRLVMMHSHESPEGRVHYVIPGGYVEPRTAELIKKHPAVTANADGLFPGQDQTWVLGG
jgi:hypothetical protein